MRILLQASCSLGFHKLQHGQTQRGTWNLYQLAVVAEGFPSALLRLSGPSMSDYMCNSNALVIFLPVTHLELRHNLAPWPQLV